MKQIFSNQTKFISTAIFIMGLVCYNIAQSSSALAQNTDLPQAQFAISHGHCNLTVQAPINHVEIRREKDDFSDILIDFSVDMTKLSSFSDQVSGELRSPAIFNTMIFPSMVFKCQDNFKLGEDWYQLRGNLTINGVSNYVRLMLTPEKAGQNSGKPVNHYYISGDVNLFNYGIDYPGETTMNKTMFININLEKAAE